MPDRRELIDRVKKTEREYHAVSPAVRRLQTAIHEGRDSRPTATSPRDLVSAAMELEATYLIRIRAEFETAIRSFRRQSTGDPDDRIGTRNLIEWTLGVRQGRSISSRVTADVHEVREYRNFLVRGRDEPMQPVPVAIDVARRRLNVFLQKLPEQW